jgi:alkylation response protein AidB-like acyl-CoA dehydrogenase
MWISFLDVAKWFLTFASLGVDEKTGRKRICAFIVDRDLAGVSVHPIDEKFGYRPLKTGELALQDVRVPASALVGEEGQGFEIAMNAVESGRLGVAARAVGLGRGACDAMVSYAKERVVFRRPIASFQLVQKMIADSLTEVEAAHWLTLHFAQAKSEGHRARGEGSMAKMYATDAALNASVAAFQVHGAAGVSSEYPVGRYLRDAKVFQIIEGTNELHRTLVAEAATGTR